MTNPQDVLKAACPSCGIAYSEHLGLIGTCQLLREARAENKRLRELVELTAKAVHLDVEGRCDCDQCVACFACAEYLAKENKNES